MDLSIAGFYGVICGALAALAPIIGPVWARIVTGAVVGVAAAWLLPMVRTALAGMAGMY